MPAVSKNTSRQRFSVIFWLSRCKTFELPIATISVWLAGQKTLSPQQIRVFENTTNTWQTGIGVIFGLLGGKAADLLDEDEDNNDAA